MDYCLNLNSSTKLKQSTRTTKQNRHFYFTTPHIILYSPQSPQQTKLVIAQYFILCGLVWGLKNCVWAILGRIFRYYC